MNGTAGALSPPPAFLTVKGLEKPGPGLADRVARTLKTAMKDTSLLLLPCCCHAALSGSEVKNRAGGGSSGGQVSERSRRRPTGPQLNEQDGR